MRSFDPRPESAYSRLRTDILTGRLLPGQRLLTTELTARYGVSVGALREGLSRLAEQGLVISEPHHGFRVRPVDRDDLDDLTEARREIETLVLRRAILGGDLAWESRLLAAHHVLDGTPQLSQEVPPRVNEAWAAAHSHFHAVLLEACPNRRLRDIAASLRDASELYRRWSRHLGRENTRDIPSEHRAILEAALQRDAARAEELLAQHIQKTTLNIIGDELPADGAAAALRPAEVPREG